MTRNPNFANPNAKYYTLSSHSIRCQAYWQKTWSEPPWRPTLKQSALYTCRCVYSDMQFLDQLHQPTASHQDVNTYLGQLDDLDYDRIEFVFDNVQVFLFTLTLIVDSNRGIHRCCSIAKESRANNVLLCINETNSSLNEKIIPQIQQRILTRYPNQYPD
jgi:hypothetical protein